MTSSSRSEAPGGRSLAVFQTPTIPEGWHGRDLVRIVDPVGLAMAWLSPAYAGAIVSFAARDSVDMPWTTLVQASTNPETTVGFTWGTDSQHEPLWIASPGWSLQTRDPTSAMFVSRDGETTVHGTCEMGQVRLTVNYSSSAIGRIEFVKPDLALIEFRSTRTNSSLHVCLYLAGENAEDVLVSEST